jgi:hypothetical protein
MMIIFALIVADSSSGTVGRSKHQLSFRTWNSYTLHAEMGTLAIVIHAIKKGDVARLKRALHGAAL